MNCEKFIKSGGGRGRPGFDSVCANCKVIWSDHPKPVQESKPAKVKLPKTKPIATLKTPVKSKAPRPAGYISPDEAKDESLDVETFLSDDVETVPTIGAIPAQEEPEVYIEPPKPKYSEDQAVDLIKSLFGEDYDFTEANDW